MSCSDCEQAQKEGKPHTFVRVGNGNVKVVACEDHLKDTIHQIREGSP